MIRVEMILGKPTVEIAALCQECEQAWAVETAGIEAAKLRAWLEGREKGKRPELGEAS